jgi:GT2 family glycosyltransferase
MIKRDVFNKIGLFDRQFEKQRMGDGEFGLRAYLNGLKNISNPKSKRIHLKVSEGGLRQMGSWDAWRPKNLFSPRPIPSVLYLTRKYFGRSASRKFIYLNLLKTLIPYKYKSNKNAVFLFLPIFILLMPVILISILRSWSLSTKKLQEGAKIEALNA